MDHTEQPMWRAENGLDLGGLGEFDLRHRLEARLKEKKEAKSSEKEKNKEKLGTEKVKKKKKHKDKTAKGDKIKLKKQDAKKKKKAKDSASTSVSSVVVVPPVSLPKPSRWETDEGDIVQPKSPGLLDDAKSKLSSAIVRPSPAPSRTWSVVDRRSPSPKLRTWSVGRSSASMVRSIIDHPSPAPSRAYSSIGRPRSPPYQDRYRRDFGSGRLPIDNSRQSLPPRSDFYRRQRDERERYSAKPRRNYTGYEYHRRRTSPIRLATTDDQVANRPSPPKDMPEHIRWLHERWSKYDRTFFTSRSDTTVAKEEQSKTDGTTLTKPAPAPGEASTSTSTEAATSKVERYPKGESMSRRNSRDFTERHGRHSRDKDNYSVPYYQFRKGGVYQPFGGIGQHFMTLKEFIMTQPGDLANDEAEALRLYEGYKLEYKRRMYADFFQSHQEDEWFLEKYHPMFKAEKETRRRDAIQKRLDVFMCVSTWTGCNATAACR